MLVTNSQPMRENLFDLRRRALNLEHAGLHRYADRALEKWQRSAQATEAWDGAAEAAAWRVRLALNRDQLADALAIGVDALPLVLGRPWIDPEVTARLYVNLTKVAWGLGREAETRAYLDAARCVIDHAAVHPLVRVHHAIAASIVALEDGDITLAHSWALQAGDVAGEIGDEAAILQCSYNLSHILLERGDFDRASELIAKPLATGRDANLADLLVNAVWIAVGQGDLVRATGYARRAIAAYCTGPSQFSAFSVAFLFETLARYYAAVGANPVAMMLADMARRWFALRRRSRDVDRVEAWLADRHRERHHKLSDDIAVDGDMLYLGDLYRATLAPRNEAVARALALSVNRLLPDVAPTAAVTPVENAALLWRLPVGERWFTSRSTVGQAAERVLSGADSAGHRGLKLLAGYERLAAAEASWSQSLRVLRKQGVDSAGLQALDELYQAATA